MTDRYLTLTIEEHDDVKRIFWDRETKKGSISNLIDESMLNNFFTYLIATTKDVFVCAIPAEEFIIADWGENESAKRAAENTLEDDNPILAFYYFD